MNQEHKTATQSRSKTGGFIYRCECGWESPSWFAGSAAADHWKWHVREVTGRNSRDGGGNSD